MVFGDGCAEKLAEKDQRDDRERRDIEQVTAEDVADAQGWGIEEHGGRDAGKQLGQTGDGGQQNAADECAGQAGFFVEQIDIVGCLDRQQGNSDCKDEIDQINHTFPPPLRSDKKDSQAGAESPAYESHSLSDCQTIYIVGSVDNPTACAANYSLTEVIFLIIE